MAVMLSKGGGEADRVAAAERVLEEWISRVPADAGEADRGGQLNGFFVWRLQVLGITAGRIRCAFRVPRHLTDRDGNWGAGAVGTLIDIVGAAAVISSAGTLDISVEFSISYFSSAKAEEEVDIEAVVLGDHGLLSCVEVIIRKRKGGALVARGKQWMSSNRPSQSKL